ncbi:MAG: hypothetical protein VB076_03100 [Synergistaceae bacterium]|nr:hypothetical protein [Synergistaceae bacterium]
MSKLWYPKIDYVKCNGCMTCRDMCRNGVFADNQNPQLKPEIINREGCVTGCRGCGKKCPVGAITYLGEENAGVYDPSCSCGG